MPFPVALDPFTCNRFEIAEFAEGRSGLGVRYIGLCCGAMPHHIRSIAEALGRKPPASRYSADMSKHAYFGTNARLKRAIASSRRSSEANVRVAQDAVSSPTRIDRQSSGLRLPMQALHVRRGPVVSATQTTRTADRSGPANARSWTISLIDAPVGGDDLGEAREAAGPVADRDGEPAEPAVGDEARRR